MNYKEEEAKAKAVEALESALEQVKDGFVSSCQYRIDTAASTSCNTVKEISITLVMLE